MCDVIHVLQNLIQYLHINDEDNMLRSKYGKGKVIYVLN
jgi:hypothetical protein